MRTISLASMINSKEGRTATSAKELVKKEFPAASDEELAKGALFAKQPIINAINSIQKSYGYTADIKLGSLTVLDVKTQIDKTTTIFLALNEVRGTRSHGAVLMGYILAKNNSLDSYYYFWNPWWRKVMLTNQKDINNWQLDNMVFTWNYSLINFRKEAIKTSETPTTITEVNKTMMINNQSGIIKTLPTGRVGSEYINSSGKFAGCVVNATQKSETDLYCNELKDWVDKSALAEVISINISTKIVNSGFSIDYIPWQSGIQHIGYTKDHINRNVTIAVRIGSYYFVPELGWIDKKAFNST